MTMLTSMRMYAAISEQRHKRVTGWVRSLKKEWQTSSAPVQQKLAVAVRSIGSSTKYTLSNLDKIMFPQKSEYQGLSSVSNLTLLAHIGNQVAITYLVWKAVNAMGLPWFLGVVF